MVCFTSKAESTIYFFENHPYLADCTITLNGDTIPLPERKFKKTNGFTKLTSYYRAQTKCIVPGDDKVVITFEFLWMERPFHDEISLDLNDGEIYYILLTNNSSAKMKILSEKEGQKKLKEVAKKTDDWVINSDIQL